MNNDYNRIAGQRVQRIEALSDGVFAIAQTLYAIGALLCFINTYLSIAVIVLIQLNYALAILPGRLARREAQP